MLERDAAALALLGEIDLLRHLVSMQVGVKQKFTRSQFFTPAALACQLASGVRTPTPKREISILDPGAGIGMLSATLVLHFVAKKSRPKSLSVTLIESDRRLVPALRWVFRRVSAFAATRGVQVRWRVYVRDFLTSAPYRAAFDCVVSNPPYQRLSASSKRSKLLRQRGVHVPNLYAAFAWLSMDALVPGGSMAFIVPRSFASGTSFRHFRMRMRSCGSICALLSIENRRTPFRDDDVLQEVLLLRARKARQSAMISVGTVAPRPGMLGAERRVPSMEVLGAKRFGVRWRLSATARVSGKRVRKSLHELGLTVTTGRVVLFRESVRIGPSSRLGQARVALMSDVQAERLEVTYKQRQNSVWLTSRQRAAQLVLPAGHHVLVRRFSPKEQNARIVAAAIDTEAVPGGAVAVENHVNVISAPSGAMSREMAYGIAVFLRSREANDEIGSFLGSTQVNASDLRELRLPDRASLEKLGSTELSGRGVSVPRVSPARES